METKEYSLKINPDSKHILITGITTTPVSIDFSGDIDFTRLVNELIISIDSKVVLTPNEGNDTSEDGTLVLILETIDSIINDYNNTVGALVESSDEDIVSIDESEFL
jgi:hypothetical protein